MWENPLPESCVGSYITSRTERIPQKRILHKNVPNPKHVFTRYSKQLKITPHSYRLRLGLYSICIIVHQCAVRGALVQRWGRQIPRYGIFWPFLVPFGVFGVPFRHFSNWEVPLWGSFFVNSLVLSSGLVHDLLLRCMCCKKIYKSLSLSLYIYISNCPAGQPRHRAQEFSFIAYDFGFHLVLCLQKRLPKSEKYREERSPLKKYI